MTDNIPLFDEFVIVELFGHQRFAGRMRQAAWPAGFAELTIPATDGHEAVTQLLSPQSIYRLTPTTEAVATAVAARCRPEPVHRWELPAPEEREERDSDADWIDSNPFDDEDDDLDDEAEPIAETPTSIDATSAAGAATSGTTAKSRERATTTAPSTPNPRT